MNGHLQRLKFLSEALLYKTSDKNITLMEYEDVIHFVKAS